METSFKEPGFATPEMPGSIEALDQEIELIDKTILELERKLSPVLALAHPVMTEAKQTTEATSQLRGRIERLTSLRVALASIVGRIDL